MRIAVAGATGRVGRHVVDLLQTRGHEVARMSRAIGVDVTTGVGLDDAVADAEAIVDATAGPSPDKDEATEFFTTSTRNLQRAADRAGVRRIVVVSVVGADRFTGGYGVAKVAHERAMLAGPVPATILRATQFHELVGQLVEVGTQDDVARVPKLRAQLVAARTVAESLADLAVGEGHAGQISEIAGPRVENLVDMAARFAARRGTPSRVEGVSNPADPDRELLESDGLLPGPDAKLAGPTFEEWLEATY